MLDELVGFTVPEWMLDKMKAQMRAQRTDSSHRGGALLQPDTASLSQVSYLSDSSHWDGVLLQPDTASLSQVSYFFDSSHRGGALLQPEPVPDASV